MKEAVPSQVDAGSSTPYSCSNSNPQLVDFKYYMKHELGLSSATVAAGSLSSVII
ncbi:hypothetical protein [Kosakonia sp. S42]|uniref:hypothetical protein n=1 Tax=Kosakonia sp. S42 TaxID=2767458 RepID=UPI00190D8F3F|nr:hypothetical protein [Kosakonia sp. S42]MBK0019612.1 hypothetical protein [Kosakonia sp. S42]